MTASAWPCPARPTAPAWGGGGGVQAGGPRRRGGGVVVAALRLAMERYGERITVSGSVEFKAAAIRAAVDVQRPITFADPPLESRRPAQATKGQARRRPGVPPAGQKPPPGCRNGRHTLVQLDQVRIEGEAQRPVQAPTQSTPTPPAAKVQQPTRPVLSELEQRAARLRLPSQRGRGLWGCCQLH